MTRSAATAAIPESGPAAATLGRAERKNTAMPTATINTIAISAVARNAHSHRAASATPLSEAINKKFKGTRGPALVFFWFTFGVIPTDIIFEKYIGKSQVEYAYSR